MKALRARLGRRLDPRRIRLRSGEHFAESSEAAEIHWDVEHDDARDPSGA